MPKVYSMKDNTRAEEEFESDHTIRGQYGDQHFVLLGITLIGIPVTITGIWALVQCTMFFPITTQASISVIIISVLANIVGVLMIAVNIGCVVFVKYERPSGSNLPLQIVLMPYIVTLFILAVILLAVGIAAGALIPSLSESIGTSANISLFTTIHDSQGARDAWDAAQNTLKCCGAVNVSDYEQVFNNFSVPVSCCNTTNPLANETTCPDIVMDITNVTTELIYTEGCVPQLVSYFHYIHTIVAGVGTIVIAIPLIIMIIIWIIIGTVPFILILCLKNNLMPTTM